MRIIKLGGSLLNNDRLLACLERIAKDDEASVIVPGGGLFADQVRSAQKKWQFHDIAAHHMAILAMQQMALLINALHASWPPLHNLPDLKAWVDESRTAIWFPEIALLNHHTIPASWAVTSDSLAAWLASILDAEALIIVKAANVPEDISLADCVQQGILDEAFLHYAQAGKRHCAVINSDDFINSKAKSNAPSGKRKHLKQD